FARTLFVGVALDDGGVLRMLVQPDGLRRQRRLRLGRQNRLVDREQHPVADGLGEVGGRVRVARVAEAGCGDSASAGRARSAETVRVVTGREAEGRGEKKEGGKLCHRVYRLFSWLDGRYHIIASQEWESAVNHGISGDHAGSLAAPSVGTARRFRPDMSTENSCAAPPAPALSRVNMITRPFGAHVGPSSRNEAVSRRSSLPSARITPMWKRPAFCLVKAIRSPRGLQTGVPYRPSPKLIRAGSPPPAAMTYSCWLPDRSLSNTIRLPSGEKDGAVSIEGAFVSCAIWPEPSDIE